MSNTIRGVLLVDDEPIVLKSAKRLLERKKFKVFVANTGSSAISVFQENRDQIGAILLDLSMPDMDGEEILEKLIEVDAAAKVILFSGYARSAELEPLFEKGAIDHIQKPFELPRLISALESAMVASQSSRIKA
jgi:two-component system cell cycle sensor histidine kinase/response regulator CckA